MVASTRESPDLLADSKLSRALYACTLWLIMDFIGENVSAKFCVWFLDKAHVKPKANQRLETLEYDLFIGCRELNGSRELVARDASYSVRE